ncbi:MAG: hypothetical protein P8008_01700 [Gammaproteobacteria bacterium]
MFDLLQALDLIQITITNLSVGTGIMLGAFAGTALPAHAGHSGREH